ncbi:MAG: hypothetical protein KA201_26635, partial [Kofleriaceae bacterium]|nr:hypothetical protein [Kofleriaceae bacterium]
MPPSLEVHTLVSANPKRGQIFQLVTTDDRIWAVGGRTSNPTLLGSCTGQRFHSLGAPPKGVR